jgi:hypothetical protein
MLLIRIPLGLIVIEWECVSLLLHQLVGLIPLVTSHKGVEIILFGCHLQA